MFLFSDSIYLFVVNHPGDKDVVEKFRFDEKTRKLYYVRTYTDPIFTQSVVATPVLSNHNFIIK